MEEDKKPIQVNTDFTKNPELLAQLDEMVAADESDRSKFIRKLVRQEYARRHQLTLPLLTTETSKKTGSKRQSATVPA